MRAPLNILLTTWLVIAAFSSIAIAQIETGCITDDCHAAMGTKEFVHGPVGAGICTVCHNPVEGEDHTFKFAVEKGELCLGCHDRQYTHDGKVVVANMKAILKQNKVHHGPIKQNDC